MITVSDLTSSSSARKQDTGSYGFDPEEEKKKLERYRKTYLGDNVPNTFQQDGGKPSGPVKIEATPQQAALFQGGQSLQGGPTQNPTAPAQAGQDNINQVPVKKDELKATANPPLNINQTTANPSNSVAILSDAERQKVAEDSLKKGLVDGTIASGDKIKLNAEAMKKELLDKTTELHTNLKKFDDIMDKRGLFKGLSKEDQQRLKDIGGSEEYEKNLQRLNDTESKINDYNIFLNRATSDPEYLRNVYVNSQYSTEEQIREAQKIAEGNRIEAAVQAAKDFGDYKKAPEGFWDNIQNGTRRAIGIGIGKSYENIKKSLGQLLGNEKLVQDASDTMEQLDLSEALNPDVYGKGDGQAADYGYMVGGFARAGVEIAAVAAASFAGPEATGAALTAVASGYSAESWGNTYQAARDSGADDETALKAASVSAGVTYITNKFGNELLLKNIPGFDKLIGSAAGGEAITALQNNIGNMAMRVGATAGTTFVEQAGIGGGQQIALNLSKRIYDENADAFADVGDAAWQAGAFGVATTGLLAPLGLIARRTDSFNPQASKDARMLVDNGVLQVGDAPVTKIEKPLELHRGTVPDDSTRPIKQIGESYTENPLGADLFGVEASAQSGQPGIVKTVELKAGSKIVSIPDVYDARLLDPKDPRIQGADAVRLEPTHVQYGEAEVVVLNKDAVVFKSERPAKTALELAQSDSMPENVSPEETSYNPGKKDALDTILKNPDAAASKKLMKEYGITKQDISDAKTVQGALSAEGTTRPVNQVKMEEAINSNDIEAQKEIYKNMTPDERASVSFLPDEVTSVAKEAKSSDGKYKIVKQEGITEMVDGEPVDLVKGIDTFIRKGDGGYVVSEASTGRFLSESASKEGAVAKARSAINEVGEDKFKELISKYKVEEPVSSKKPVESTTEEAKPKTSRQAAQEPIGNTENVRESSAYKRVKSRLAEEYQNDLSYVEHNLEADAKAAVEFVASDPKKAKRIALGIENPPKGMTETAISIAAANAAEAAGDTATQARLEAARSLRQTRRGQEIVAERGRFDENSPHTFISQVIQERMAKIARETPSETVRSVSGKKAGKASKESVTKIIDSQANAAKKVIEKSQMKISQAQSLIDALTC